MDRLKPCPFCGGEAEYMATTDFYGGDELENGFYECKACHARTDECENADDAIAAWNARAEWTCHIEMDEDAPVCSLCGSSILIRDTFELRSWGGDTETIKLVAYPHCPNCGAKVIGGSE